MQAANVPAKFLIPFAQQDPTRVEIPATTSDPTRFSQALGSPPLTGQPPEAGGVPPQLPDFNGALNQIARGVWWALGGNRYPFDATWSSDPAIGGYARGAVLPSVQADGTLGLGEWYSAADNNTTNPDTVGTGWVPGYQYGATTLTTTGGAITLTPAQAAKTTLRINGTLTSNAVITLPAWVYEWTVYNDTAGAFTVSVRNAGTSAVVVPQQTAPTKVRSDGAQVETVSVTVAAATQLVAGIQRNATQAEANAGTLTTATITPSVLGGAIDARVPAASSTVAGKARAATAAEVAAASMDTVFVTPAGMAQTKTVAWITGLSAALDARPTTGSSAVFADVSTANGYFYRGADGTLSIRVQNDARDQSAFFQLRSNGGSLFPGGMTCNSNISAQGTITAAGGFQPSSSRDLKDLQGPSPYGLAEVLRLQVHVGKYHNWFNSDGRQRVFLVAEDIAEVMPPVATPNVVRATPPGGKERDYAGYSLEQMVAVLVQAVQDLNARIDTLEAR